MVGNPSYTGKEKPLVAQLRRILRSNPETRAYRELKASLTKDPKSAEKSGQPRTRSAGTGK
jgi:hypothetical protein